MYSDGSNSDGSSDQEDAGRDKKALKRSGGKSTEKKKKHDKHKKHKKSKKHKKHRHHSDDDSEGKSDDESVSTENRKRPQQPSPERYTGKEAKGDRGLQRGRDPPQEHPRQDREERLLKLDGPSSRWDSPGVGEGRQVHTGANHDHSKSQRTRPQMEGRDDNSHRHDERYQRESNRRRSPPVARSRSRSNDHPRDRVEPRERRRYTDGDNRRGGEGGAPHHTGPVRHEEHYRGNKNGREHRAASPTYQHNATRFDEGRRGLNRRNDNFGEYNTGSGSRRAQEHSGGGDDGRQRRYPSPNQSYRGQQQQQRGRERPYPGDERDERQHRGDNRNEFRNQRANREPHAEENRDRRGPAPDDRNRRERNEDRERERGREATKGDSRPVEVKVERTSSSPTNARGRAHSHNTVGNQSEPGSSGNRRGRERSPMGRGPRRPPFRPEQENEEEQFEWGGGRREADSNRPQTRQPHVPRMIKAEELAVKKEEPGSDSEPAEPPKQKPNFALSGKLTEETNKVNGTVIAYAEPPGARKPKRRWRLYPFKGEQTLPTLYIHRQSCYLIGRDRKVCDLPVDHPSCSKQHAVLQYRLVPYQKDDGSTSQRVRPYIIDLESANGTFVNNKKIEPKRYVELLEKDVLKFGFSSREYVLLHENSKEDNEDDDGYEVSPTSKPFAGANSNVGPN
uniref:FHA domain-containing protein n=1 Tax=Anopheles atroparvus TaxID=41427 RepID=A0AAG5D6X1_ANOAO